MNLNITISPSDKSYKDKILEFVDRVASDIKTIETLDNSTEIRVEYESNLDLNKSILIVSERIRKIEEAKKRIADELEIKKLEEEAISKVEKSNRS